ncbi:MAG TPA: hypothetical protein VGR01_00780 [Burkholderiales bacterium]|jgi:hypothetical protein|nr:hypothetical protein [Burkholderiales bacterium]
MSATLRKLKTTNWYNAYRNWRRRRKQARELRDWERSGRPSPPPPQIKRGVIRAYAAKYDLRVFVETGTYRGDTVEAMKDLFDRIYSIELSRGLFEKARERFKSFKHIEIIHGDSGTELGRIVNRIDQPALFYLDGHYSAGETARGEKDTPIFEELHHILNSSETEHVILVDDARCFGADPAYPSIDDLTRFVHAMRSEAQVTVEDDCIRITPPPV